MFKKTLPIAIIALLIIFASTSIISAQSIRWRLQSYAGPALNDHVCKNAIDEFNKAANGEMIIDVYAADQLVPHGELFNALQSGTVDMAVSDDYSMGCLLYTSGKERTSSL